MRQIKGFKEVRFSNSESVTKLKEYRDGNYASGEDVIHSNYKLLVQLADRIGSYVGVCPEDLLQEGLLAAFEKLRDFDESRGVKVTSYLGTVAKFAMLEYVKRQSVVTIPPSTLSAIQKIKLATESSEGGLTVSDIALQSGYTETRVRKLSKLSDFGASQLSDDLESEDDFYASVRESDLTFLFNELQLEISKLSEFEQSVIRHRFFEEKTLEESAEILGVSYEWIRKQQIAIVEKLRKKMSKYE